MIVDKVDNLDCYRGLSRNLDKAIDFLLKRHQDESAEGRHDIDGDAVFALFQTYMTKNAGDVRFEAHRKYIDIQYLQKGEETIYCANVQDLQTDTEYSAENDAEFLKDGESIPLRLSQGWFAILFPQDAHKPCCVRNTPQAVNKIILKVHL